MNQPVFKHQDFSIDQSARLKVVRQDRFFPYQANHAIKFNEKSYAVENYSSFGIAVKNFDGVSDGILRCVYLVDNIEICDLNFTFVRNDDREKLTIFSIENQPLPIEAIQAVEKSKEVIAEFEKSISKFFDVKQEFKNSVSEFKGWIEELENRVNGLERTSFNSSRRELNEYEEAVAHYTSRYLMLNIYTFSSALAKSLNGIPQNDVKRHYEFLRSQVGHIFYKSPYGSRAFNKPRGYAGDFEMMNNVYFNELRGDSLFAKCVQRYFTDNPAGKAVRNRADYLNRKISDSIERNPSSKILGVASGPAREIQKFFSERPAEAARCEIHLLDQDTEALKYSQKEIYEICRAKGVRPNIQFHNLAIKNIISDGLPMNDFDLIYSAGLFDYFTDPVAQFAANKLFNGLKTKGELIIGNFGADNPAQFVMEAFGDWYLIYRDAVSLEKIFKQITPNLSIESEHEGINLFAIFKK